jgi:hypothetical protein
VHLEEIKDDIDVLELLCFRSVSRLAEQSREFQSFSDSAATILAWISVSFFSKSYVKGS